MSRKSAWPSLPLAEWQDTMATLHLWTQVVGKVRLALAPMVNHWWQVPLYVNARGLTTSAMPFSGGDVEIIFDFLAHQLRLETSAGGVRTLALEPMTVAEFYQQVMAALGELEVDARIWPEAVELPEAVRLDQDESHASYDADAAQRFWRLLVEADRVLHQFRGKFLGKCSPVHFFWGSFDLACTRFSGRRAPTHPGGIPHLADWVTREAYSHECISAGWWPGGGAVSDAAFYAYAYPEPAGCPTAVIRPSSAGYNTDLHEWVLPYEAMRTSSDPDAELMAFLESTYGAAADLGGWDRGALERQATR